MPNTMPTTAPVAPAARTEYRRARGELETMLGLDPIEVIHDRRRTLLTGNAELKARVETWDKRRKHLHAVLVCELVDTLEPRPAVPVLEARAYAHPRYVAFLEQARADVAAWALVDMELRNLEELVNRDQRLIGYATAEARI